MTKPIDHKKHLRTKPPEKASQTHSALESFRRNPADLQAALKLTETHGEEVARRYLKEAALPSPNLRILTAAVNYFKKISDWENHIPLLNKSLEVLAGKTNKKSRETINQLLAEKAYAHVQLKSFKEAEDAIKKVIPKELPKSYFDFYIEIVTKLEMRKGNFEGLVHHLDKIKNLAPSDAMDRFIHAQLAATLFHCGVIKPSVKQASRLIKAIELQQEEGVTFDSSALAWLYLCAGQSQKAREICPEDKFDEDPSTSIPLAACILEQEGKIEAAQKRALQTLDRLLEIKQNNEEAAILSFNFYAIISELIRISDVPRETYAELLSAQPEETKAAAAREPLAEADSLKLIFSLRPKRKGKKASNAFQSKFDQALVQILSPHLRQIGIDFKSDVLVEASESTIAKLNRLAGTSQEFRSQLQSVKDNMDQIVRVLTEYGFLPKKIIEKDCRLVITEISTSKTLSELESFRRDPSNLDQALKLSEKNYEEVATTLKYELENPVPSRKVIETASSYFNKKSTEVAIKFFEKLLLKTDDFIFFKGSSKEEIARKKSSINMLITLSYYELNNLRKAREALRKISPRHILPGSFQKFLDYHNILERDNKNYLSFLNRIRKLVPPEALESYEMYHLAARLLASRFTRPSADEAINLHKQYFNSHSEMTELIGGFSIIWNWLCTTGEQTKDPNEFFKNTDKAVLYRTVFEEAALVTIVTARAGKTEEAQSKAQQILAELANGRSNKDESAIIFSSFSAVMAEIERIAQEPKENVPSTAVNPEIKTAAENQDSTSPLADAIFSDWDLYREVFPKDRRVFIRENLEQNIDNSTSALQGEKIEDYLDKDLDILEGKNVAGSAAEKLGISSITLNKQTLDVSFHLKDGSIVSGRINNNLDLEIKNVRDLHELRLAGRFLLAVILEKLVETLYEGVDSPTVEEALTAEPEPTPIPVQVTVSPEIPEGVSNPLPTEKIAEPQISVETVRVAEPAPSERSPQEIFFKTNKLAFQNLRKAISGLGIDVIDLTDTSVRQIPDLQTVIANQRVVDEAPGCFRAKPYSWDPLSKVLDEIRIYGPRNGKAVLKEEGVGKEKLDEFGFGNEDPSPLLSVVEFRFGSGKKLIGILDRSGDLIIPGDGLEEEAIYPLNRTALECLAGIVVPDAESVYQNAGLSPTQRQAEIKKIQDKEPQEPALRSRKLPALLVLRDGSLKSVGKAIRVLMTEAQKAELAKKPLLKWDLFTRTSKSGKVIYEPFPEDEAQRSKLLDHLPRSRIFVRLREGYSYRLPVWEKTANGKTYLLPWEMSMEMQEAAKVSTSLDFRTRLYLYAVLHYLEQDNEKLNAPLLRDGVIPVIQPKVSVIPEQAFPPEKSIMPQFKLESFNGFRLLVHKTVSESDVIKLLMTPEASRTISQWQHQEIPPELNALPRDRKNKIPEQAQNEIPDRQYLMIVPTHRGFNQGIFISLDEIKLPMNKSDKT